MSPSFHLVPVRAIAAFFTTGGLKAAPPTTLRLATSEKRFDHIARIGGERS